MSNHVGPFSDFDETCSQGLILTIIGAAVGLLGAYLTTRAITSVLYGVSATIRLHLI